MAEDWTENSRVLKVLIIGMTTLLILGMIAFIIGMARTASKMSEKMGDIETAVPAGATLINVAVGDKRLYLGLRKTDGSQSVLVVSKTSGRRIGELHLMPAP
jgi:hypothetical protein